MQIVGFRWYWQSLERFEYRTAAEEFDYLRGSMEEWLDVVPLSHCCECLLRGERRKFI